MTSLASEAVCIGCACGLRLAAAVTIVCSACGGRASGSGTMRLAVTGLAATGFAAMRCTGTGLGSLTLATCMGSCCWRAPEDIMLSALSSPPLPKSNRLAMKVRCGSCCGCSAISSASRTWPSPMAPAASAALSERAFGALPARSTSASAKA